MRAARSQEKMGLTLGITLGAKTALQKVRRTKEGVPDQTPWAEVAAACKFPLAQVCGCSQLGQVFLQETLNDTPLETSEDGGRSGLPCVAFNNNGVFSASQSFQELCGRTWGRLGGMDLRKVPLHSLTPDQQHRKLNNEPWVTIEKLHQQSFSSTPSRAGKSKTANKQSLVRAAGTKAGSQAGLNQAGSMVMEEDGKEGVHDIKVALMVSPGRRGKPFWNLLHAFSFDYLGQLVIVHVLMPLETSVPTMLWMPKENPDSVNPGPAPDVLQFLDMLMQRLRWQLPDLHREEALHICRLPRGEMLSEEPSVAHVEALLEEGNQSNEGMLKTKPLTTKGARLRFGDDDSPHEKGGSSPEHIKQAHHRRSLTAYANSLPDSSAVQAEVEFEDLEDAGMEEEEEDCMVVFHEGYHGSLPKVLQAAEKGCRKLLQALEEKNAYSGLHFVPRTGDVAMLLYPELKSWERCFEEATDVRSRLFPPGSIPALAYTATLQDLVNDWLKIQLTSGKETGRRDRHNLSTESLRQDPENLPFVVMDPNEVDCPLVYVSSGFEEMTGHWRSWALGRNIRFLLLQDGARNVAYNGQEIAKIDDFCQNNEQDEETRRFAPAVPGAHIKRYVFDLSRQSPNEAAKPYQCSVRTQPLRELGDAVAADAGTRRSPTPVNVKPAEDDLVAVLLIKGPKSSVPFWTVLYLRHVWLKDPGTVDSRVDQAYKHYVFCSFVPMTAQKAAIEDLLPWDFSKHSEHMALRIRQMLQERAHQLAQRREAQSDAAHQLPHHLDARSMANLIDEVVPDWLLEPGNERISSCSVGCQFVPRVGLRSVARFEGRWPSLLRSMEAQLQEVLGKLPKDLLERTVEDDDGGLMCWVLDPHAKDYPLVFFGKPLQKLSGFSSEQALARNARFLQPKMSRIDHAINGDERKRIKDFCERCSTADNIQNPTEMSILLLEKKCGRRFFALLQMIYATDPDKPDQGYVLGVLTNIDSKMPAVLQSHQISELQEDETGLALDEWGAYFSNLRSEMKQQTSKGTSEVCNHWADKLQACLRDSEDYDGDHFVPRNGVVEVNAFQQSGVLKHVLKEIQEDCRHIFDCPTWDAEDREQVLSIADPRGEDCPLVYISPGFEELTGYQREWVLGRNCRFLEPKDQARNQQFNADQLANIDAFCRSGRIGARVNTVSLSSLLINETRSGSPFWNLSCLQLVEVLGRTYIITMSRPVSQEKVRLAELLCLDPEGLDQLHRLKKLLLRYEGGAKFTSLSSVMEQLISAFMADFPATLKAPALSQGMASTLPLLNQLSLFGMEVGAGNMKAMADALKSGLRHLHIALPSGPATKTAEEGAFVRKILPLKLAEVMNSFNQQHLHYIREATVITVRSPPHLLPVLSEVRKTLLTHGYSVLCWLLDVRGCNAAETAQHWQALGQSRHPGEALGLYGGGPRMLNAAQGVRGGCPVSIYAAEMHPGRKSDEQEVRMMGKLRGVGIVPMACNIFGPRDAWIHSAEAKAAAARIGLEPKMLALKWAEHRGFLAIATQMLQGEPADNPVHMHRTFVRQYRAAPSAEACMAALAGAQVSARTRSAGVTDSGQQADTLPTRPLDSAKPHSARSRVMTAIEPSNAAMAIPASTPRRSANSPEELQKEKVQVQALPNVLDRARTPTMPTGVVSWENGNEARSTPTEGRASPGPARSQSRASSQRPPSRTDPEDDNLYHWDYDLPPRPASIKEIIEDMEAAKIPPPPSHAFYGLTAPPSASAKPPSAAPSPANKVPQMPRLPASRGASTDKRKSPPQESAGYARKILTPRDMPWTRKTVDPRLKVAAAEGFQVRRSFPSERRGNHFPGETLFASKGGWKDAFAHDAF
eukprot:CAMPEP_0197644268 /NCGR_PEP_ID=MMETSP1338-20131121/17298_1 /TAXON_ID=43686 ORGANISM="Pelagodinium beii, Strain RCC1491" /NCGR_SAMPLE_ID=MMETSP1338 /ASSEMBLY_ACC=CAM_ASM_000754 /LENGTH=1843 /DNA_ID=CAMNT_0043217639 /DNA_START=27 /DNA_END=5558 /DNA_ORIENTATION=+